MLVIGSLSLLGGFIALASLQSVPAMILFTLLFSVGEMLIVPTLDTLASKLASEITTGSYFGFVSLGWALGGLLGNLGGGLLYAWLRSGGTYQAFWLANAILAAATCFAFILLDRRYGQPGS
jgi:DHA1 family multidrug resistance protein-like MFS transporter